MEQSDEWSRTYLALGQLTVAWSQVERQLRMLAAELVGADDYPARVLLGRVSAARLIEMCRAVVATATNESKRRELSEWLRAVEDARTTRNRFVHGTWTAREGTGDPALLVEGYEQRTASLTDSSEIGPVGMITRLAQAVNELMSQAPSIRLEDLELQVTRRVGVNIHLEAAITGVVSLEATGTVKGGANHNPTPPGD